MNSAKVIEQLWPYLLFAFTVGFYLGVWLEARRWRGKGDHSYMNRCESGGKLYTVKREQQP